MRVDGRHRKVPGKQIENEKAKRAQRAAKEAREKRAINAAREIARQALEIDQRLRQAEVDAHP